MPRVARIKSPTNTYHIMLRGIDKGDIFLEKADYHKFLYCILNAKEKSIFTIYAYCLMTNHVHILINSESEEIGSIIRRIAVAYAQYHNNKYGRTGHLFQNRFRSEAIYDDRYFLTVLRYIHQNPIKAGIVKRLSYYPWSSYFEYTNKNCTTIINTSFALDFFKGLEDFKSFLETQNDDNCMEYSNKKTYTDKELSKIISSISDINRLPLLDIKNRNKEIKRIRELTGASNRQLSRVLNIGRGILDRVK